MTNTDKKRLDELCAGKSAEWFETRAEYLGGFITEQRLLTMTRTLDMRTRYMTVCMENTFHPQNASALVRTCEAFGIQDIYTIDNLCRFNPNLHIVKGTDKWIDIRRSGSTDVALDTLQSAGYRIIATTPHRGDCTPEQFDVTAGPFAIVFGTEHAGISQQVTERADGFVRIPMCGFVESLNVSASASVLLYILAQKVRNSGVDWQLSHHERNQIMFRWLMLSIKDSYGVLERGFSSR